MARMPPVSRAGSVLGTPAYMAPEQARGDLERVDERADVFGLGAILCEILTGRPPYVGTDSGDVQRLAARAELDDAFDRLGACGAEPELVALSRQCLAARPDDRPRDAGIVASGDDRLPPRNAGTVEAGRAPPRGGPGQGVRGEDAAAAGGRPGGGGGRTRRDGGRRSRLVAPPASCARRTASIP